METACRDRIPDLWLTGWQHPEHNTLWRFYKKHRPSMRELFGRAVRTAVTMGVVDLAVQAVDGTKVVANALVNRSYDAEGLRGLLVWTVSDNGGTGLLHFRRKAGQLAALLTRIEDLGVEATDRWVGSTA